ncbi:ATPase [Pasteurellaceae bacterium LFhippo2]|nr:ATPase [Pasteurellaceae bacterium LFhippo2]
MEHKFHISELLDVKQLETIQHNFSKAMGVALVVVDNEGIPVIEPSGFCDFCRLARENPKFADKCFQCDNAGGRAAMSANKPVVYRCSCGFVEFAVPLIVHGQYLGAFISGQVRVEQDKEQVIPFILDYSENWKNNPNLLKAYQAVNRITYEKFEAAAHLLFNVTKSLAEQNYLNTIQKELHAQSIKLETELRTRAELEKALSDAEYKALSYQINPHFLFNVLNTISRLAFLEDAKQTEDIVHNFSDMMRYILKKSDRKLITVGSELNSIESYFSIQSLRMQDRFAYQIKIDSKYLDIECPFLILQPLIENFFKYVVEPREKGSFIKIKAYDNQKDLFIDIIDNGNGISPTEIAKVYAESLDENNQKTSLGLRNIHRRLQLSFGNEYGLTIQSQNKQGCGSLITIKIPMNKH